MPETVRARLARVRTRWQAPYSQLWWVGEGVDWVIDWYARELMRLLEGSCGLPCRLAASCRGVRQQLVHFASRNAYFSNNGASLHPSNRAVMTWFHGADADPDPENQRMIRLLSAHAPRFRKIVTACSIGRDRLLAWGIPPEQLAVVPLGVDLARFRPAQPGEREAMRRRLEIPPSAVCLGSFQKDGLGWGDGVEPKRIKGPDVLLALCERLAARYPLLVLLTGPARGYVKRGLDRRGIAYRHVYLAGADEIAACYRALDLYVIPARDEGGPMAVLESLASGVPLVSTRVGMVEDVIRDGRDGLLAQIEDVDALAAAAGRMLDDPGLRERCVRAGIETARGYGWDAIARRYYEEVYAPLLGSDG